MGAFLDIINNVTVRKNREGDTQMGEFTPITTQEEFDAAIKDRLARAEEKFSKKYEGFMSSDDVSKLKQDYELTINGLQKAADENAKKYADYDKQIAERDARIKGYETASVKTRIAHELGLPYGAADYLKGEDEKSIKESAEAVKKLFGTSRRSSTSPEASTETPTGDSKKEAYKQLLDKITNKNQ